MTFDANFKATTQSKLLEKAVDTLLLGNVLASRLLTKPKMFAGETLDKTVIVSAASNGGSFSGMDKFNTNTVDTKVRLSFDVRGYEQPVVLPGFEIDANVSSEHSVLLMAEAMEEATNEAIDQIGTLLYSDGTGNSNKNFLGLAAIIDDGGEVSTYGGQLRSTYTTLKANETDLGGPITLAAMATMYDSCEKGTDAPTLIVTTPTIWSSFEALHQPVVSATHDGRVKVAGGLYGQMGFTGLNYRNAVVVKDEKATASTMFFINERHLAFYSQKATLPGYSPIMAAGNKQIEGVYSDEGAKNTGFYWSGWRQPVDQYAIIGHIILKGNLLSFNPNRHGVLNTIS